MAALSNDDSDFPIIETGEITLDGKTYYYEVSKLSDNSFGCNLIEVFFEGKSIGFCSKFPDRSIEYLVRVVRDAKRW